MGMLNKAQAIMLGAAVAVTTALPMGALADGHTSEFAGNKGFVGDKGFVGHVPAVKHRHKHKHRVKKRTYAEAAAASACPTRFSGVYRGTLYCQNGKILK